MDRDSSRQIHAIEDISKKLESLHRVLDKMNANMVAIGNMLAELDRRNEQNDG